MDTSGDDNKLNNIEYEVVYTERDAMGDVGVVYMKTELRPTGGRDNILRFEKPVDSGADVCVQVQVDDRGDDAVPVDDSGGLEVLPQSKLMVKMMHVPKFQTKMAVVMMLSTTKMSMLMVTVLLKFKYQ